MEKAYKFKRAMESKDTKVREKVGENA